MATTIHDILFEIRLKAETEREKGTDFERLMKLWFMTDPRYSELEKVWLWEEFPGRKDFGGKDIDGGAAEVPASAPSEIEVWCRIPVGGYQICQLDEETTRVDLDGISFLIKESPVLEKLESQFDADSRDAELKAEAARLLSESGIDNDALGVIFKRASAGAGYVEIVPAIWVKAVDTMFLENACGSGSIAASLAEAFAGRTAAEYTIKQPSGRPLIITHEKDSAGTVQAAHFRGPIRYDGVLHTLQL